MSKECLEYLNFALSEGGRVALNLPLGNTLVAAEYKNCRCEADGLYCGLGSSIVTRADGNFFKMTNNNVTHQVCTYYYEQSGYKRLGFFATTSTGRLYHVSNNGTQTLVLSDLGALNMCALPSKDGYDGVCVAAASGLWMVDRQGNAVKYFDKTNKTVCFFGDRVFFAEGSGVRFSDAGNLTDFTESAYGGGRIEILEGEGVVEDMLPLDDCILLFKKDCVLQFFAKGAAKDFRVRKLTGLPAPIVKGSAVRCGKYTVFTGIDCKAYRMEGGRVEILAQGLPAICASSNTRPFASDGSRYYIGTNQYTLAINVLDGRVHTFHTMYGISNSYSGTVGFYKDNLRMILPAAAMAAGETSEFTVRNWAFKDEKEKVIEKLVFYGSGTMGLTWGKGEYASSVSVALSESGVSVPIQARGKRFDFTLKPGYSSRLIKLDVEYSLVGGA